MDKHYGTYSGGRLRAASFSAAVRSWPEGTNLEFTVREATKQKTTPQNAYLHVLFRLAARSMAELTGQNCTLEMVKAYAKVQGIYPARDMVLPDGEIVQVPIDTRDLSKEDAMITIDRTIAHFAELGIILPEPGEQMRIE
jgi:hypothetical protein